MLWRDRNEYRLAQGKIVMEIGKQQSVKYYCTRGIISDEGIVRRTEISPHSMLVWRMILGNEAEDGGMGLQQGSISATPRG